MNHDLVAEDAHLYLINGYRHCYCFGTCCFSVDRRCICPECQCEVAQERAAKVAVPIEQTVVETPEVPIVELRLPPSCIDCGVEVFRNGTRGRFPSRCPDCKEKR